MNIDSYALAAGAHLGTFPDSSHFINVAETVVFLIFLPVSSFSFEARCLFFVGLFTIVETSLSVDENVSSGLASKCINFAHYPDS